MSNCEGSSHNKVALFVYFYFLFTARLAVMSVDLGGEFIKIAIVKVSFAHSHLSGLHIAFYFWERN